MAVPLVCRPGSAPRGGGRPGGRSRPAGRGRAPVHQDALAGRASHSGSEGPDLGCAGQGGRSTGVGARTRPVRRRRSQLPARVRAHHAGEGAHRPVRERAGGRCASTTPSRLLERLLHAAEARRQDGERDRDPGVAGARSPGARRHVLGPRAAGARPVPGRTGGLRPGLRGRGPADGPPAPGSRFPRGGAGQREAVVGGLPVGRARRADPPEPDAKARSS